MAFVWDETKNSKFKSERGISFEEIVVAIEDGNLLDILNHHNSSKHPNQIILVVEIKGYAVCVPCIPQNETDYLLKTLYPSRKHTALFGLGGKYETGK